jgi:PAS domain S-box-containing protein
VILAGAAKLTLRSPELWVYLLGLSILLGLALRRVLARQTPLNDELYSKQVVIEHVQSGIAWVRSDGTVKTMNAAFAEILAGYFKDFHGRHWHELFAEKESLRLHDAYSQMLLLGKTDFEAYGKRMDGKYAGLDVRLVAVHDHKMRFVGHHLLVADRTKERMLEERIREQTGSRMTGITR